MIKMAEYSGVCVCFRRTSESEETTQGLHHAKKRCSVGLATRGSLRSLISPLNQRSMLEHCTGQQTRKTNTCTNTPRAVRVAIARGISVFTKCVSSATRTQKHFRPDSPLSHHFRMHSTLSREAEKSRRRS